LILIVTLAFVTLTVFAQRQTGSPSPASGLVMVYAGVGAEVIWYSASADGTLTRRGAAPLPANANEGGAHPSGKFLYVAWSDGGPSYEFPGSSLRRTAGTKHGVSAFRIDPATGALQAHGEAASIPARPIHMVLDITGTHVLAAQNEPSALTVIQIRPDGTLGAVIPPAKPIDAGVYAHGVGVDPANKMVVLVARGNGPSATRPEDPGALKILRNDNGSLTSVASIAPKGGYDFQPRHVAFQRQGPWVFVTLERQKKLQVFRKVSDEMIADAPIFTKDTSDKLDLGNTRPGTLRVHPNGRFVYVANRASGSKEIDGKPVFTGGDNSIAVFAVNQETGEPSRLQNADTRGMEPRTFSIDAAGRLLVVGNQTPLYRQGAQGVTAIPASLASFRIGDDGQLTFASKIDVPTAPTRSLYWMTIVTVD
jgi:6-phosphogluconolactonase (cycloisomerase 2 family)